MGAAQKKKNRVVKRPGSLFLWFFLAALGISLILHGIFLRKAGTWKVQGFAPEGYDTIVPRTFRMKRVEIDPKTLEELEATPPGTKERPRIELERERPHVPTEQEKSSKVSLLAQPKESILPEKTQVTDDELSGGKTTVPVGEPGLPIEIPEGNDRRSLVPEIKEKNCSSEGESRSEAKAPRFSSLDDLLAGGGEVTPATAPILMPTDLLFEYDSSTLKPEAAESLFKLADLIVRNAQASFRIEGHTDSFGRDDYNMGLSLRRAEEVKRWLGSRMGISPNRITTAGLGKSRLLVPSTGTVTEQRLNRRVEIVITTPQR